MSSIIWQDFQREQAFVQWLQRLSADWQLDASSLQLAASDAGFRRYFRIGHTRTDGTQATLIVMDAPPDKEDCRPFAAVQSLFSTAGLPVPQILAWDEANGFMLLNDLGQQTLLQWIEQQQPAQLPGVALPWFAQAVELLVKLQQASQPGVLPVYDAAVLSRELQLFPDWYLTAYRQCELSPEQKASLESVFDRIVQENLAAPSVYVHRDFMPRNLMMPQTGQGTLGLLDFQDALYGPITYDIACLMRDAFWTWEEDFVIDVTVRYWERARKAGLLAGQPEWETDFGLFYRAVDWMALQRHLKVAGIFARLSLRDGKPRYLADTPRFIHYIRATASRYRELTPLLRLLDQVERTQVTEAFSFGRL